jgi:hypothetical protein
VGGNNVHVKRTKRTVCTYVLCAVNTTMRHAYRSEGGQDKVLDFSTTKTGNESSYRCARVYRIVDVAPPSTDVESYIHYTR